MLIRLVGLLSLLCSIAYSYFIPPVRFGNVIRDLYGNSTDDMVMLATQWQDSKQYSFVDPSIRVGNFLGEPLLGGPNVGVPSVSIFRIYDNLPAHNVIYFDITIKIRSDWQSNGDLRLYINYSPYLYGVEAPTSNNSVPGYPDVSVQHIIGTLNDSQSSLRVQVVSYIYTLNPDSWLAVKDISLSFRNESSPKKSGGITLPTSLYLYGRTGCPPGYFSNGGTCMLCHASCQNCFGPSNSQCYSCVYGFSFVGNQCIQCPLNCNFCSGPNLGQCLLCQPGYTLDFDGTCTSSNTCKTSPFIIKSNSELSSTTALSSRFCAQSCPSGTYTLWNYTCTSSCKSPLQQVISNGNSFCQFPCNKDNSEYLYPNGTCSPNCTYNSVNETNYLFCQPPCTKYLYQNQSCLETCPDPFTPGVSPGSNTCNFPCSTSQYLYRNGTCATTCPSSYISGVDGTALYCYYPCATNEFLYSNGTCSLTCESNFLVQGEGTEKFCNYPCPIGYFLYDNGTCLQTCASTFTPTGQGVYQFCTCSANSFLYANGSCLSSCGPGFTPRIEGNLKYCDLLITGCDSSCITCNGPLASDCTSCTIDKILLNGFCSCPSDSYLYTNGSCLSSCGLGFTPRIEGNLKYCDLLITGCDSSCLTCNGPLASDCTSCTIDKILLNGACICPSDSYLVTDGRCLSSCGLGFTPRIEGDWIYCDPDTTNTSNNINTTSNPCHIGLDYDNKMTTNCSNYNNSCMPGYFQYQNGSCLLNCIDPYYAILRNGSAYCNSPSSWPGEWNNTGNNNNNTSPNNTSSNGCSEANLYKYQNGSCLSVCPYPFVSSWQNGSAYCNLPCSPGSYLSVNDTCITSCGSGYTSRIQDYFMYCYEISGDSSTCRDTPISNQSYTCSDSFSHVIDSTVLNVPSNQKTITIMFDYRISSLCNLAGPLHAFILSLTDSGIERRVADFTWEESSLQWSINVEDTNGVINAGVGTLSSSITNQWARGAVTIDLSNHFFGVAALYQDGIYQTVLPNVNPSGGTLDSWTFDSSLKLYFCGDIGGTNVNSFACDIRNVVIDYHYFSSGSPNLLVLGSNVNMIAYYKFTEGTGYSVPDQVGTVGTAYFGNSAASTQDVINSPVWLSPEGIQFNSTTQYVHIPTFAVQPMPGFPDSLSMGFTMWMKITTPPSLGSYIFRYFTSSSSTDKISLTIALNNRLSLYWEGNAWIPASSITIGRWNQLVVSLTWISSTHNDYKFLRVNGESTVLITSGGRPTFSTSTDQVRVGGFIGSMAHLKIFSQMPQTVNYATCSSNCAMELGFENPPVCLINTTCLDGTYPSGDVCLECDPSCATCLASNICSSCSIGYIKSGSSCLPACPTGSYAATPTSTCLLCPSECVTCTSPTVCQSCSPGYILYNSTCILENSTTPNNTGTNTTSNYNNGCSGANFYKYQNGSCLSTCPKPFLFVWQNNSAYCNFPCATGAYVSVNNTCITGCDPGYTPRIEGYVMICDKNTTSNDTSNNNSPSVVLQIYIRYNISLASFNSQDGLAKFVQQLAGLLGIDPSYITILSVTEGSTIIQSQISIASANDQESMDTARNLAETMGNQVSDAVSNNELDIIEGVSILDYKKSIQVVKSVSDGNQMQVSSDSSSKAVIIGLGAGLGVLGLAVVGYVIYRYKKNGKRRNKRRAVSIEPYKVEANPNQTYQAGRDESLARIQDAQERERETVKSMSNVQAVEEIDIRIEETETDRKQGHNVIDIDVDRKSKAKNVDIENVSKVKLDNERESANQVQIEGEGDKQNQQDEDNSNVDQNTTKQGQQGEDDAKPISLEALLRQSL